MSLGMILTEDTEDKLPNGPETRMNAGVWRFGPTEDKLRTK